MKNSIFSLIRFLVLLSLSPIAWAASLTALDVASLPGNRVELKLTFDSPIAKPQSYTIDQPPRIALDMPGVTNKLGSKSRELGVGNAKSIALVETADKTRLIINLATPTPHSSRVNENNLYIVLGENQQAAHKPPVLQSPPSAATASAGSPAKGAAATSGMPSSSLPSVSNIDFRRADDGAGHVVITLSDDAITPKIDERGGKIVVQLDKTQLPDALRARLDVQDFATPVKFVDATTNNNSTSITIEPVGYYEYLSFQTDNQLTVSVKPLTQNQMDKQKADRSLYTGEKLSLNFQDIDVRSVLQLIADFTKLNLVASDTVQGSITLRLDSVPWDQALDLILKTKGLDKRQVGNVLLVAPAAEIAEREKQELETQRQLAELAPLRREVIQINYAKATDIAKLFQQSVNKTGARANTENDERGSIAVDERTNNIIAYQTQERLDELRRIVTQLDIPVRQVMIEARIVEAKVGFDKSIGTSWSGASIGGDKLRAEGGIGRDNTVAGTSSDTVGTFVDLGATGATSSLGISYITNNVVLDLELSAMEKTGNGEVVSQPKVMTADKETAKILKGSEIPYQEASSSGATSTSFKEAALSLEVTPQITPDNRIIMEVKVNKDAPDYSNMTNGVPPISTNEVNAKVLVNDGETIVIGGVFTNTQEKTVDKVPFLGDLPYIGRLFRRDTVKDSKEELLIFLTPRILNHQAIAVRQ